MSANQREREGFIAVCVKNGVTVDQARALLRMAATAQRLSEAQCNGDWPADNGERRTKLCPECQCGWAILIKGVCPDCRIEQRIHEFIKRENMPVSARCEGDPRGYVIKLAFADGSYNTWGGRETGYGVPA